MKRLTVLAGAVGLLAVLVPATPAFADTTISANTFATNANFCGTGGFTLNGALEVKGGTGNIPAGGCVVNLANGARLKLTSVTLTNSGGGGFKVANGANTQVEVTGSTITSPNNVNLDPGFPSGGSNARTKVDGSTLSGAVVGVTASCNANNGRVEVTNSALRSLSGVFVLASPNSPFCDGVGVGGQAKVEKSTLNANGSAININASARTEARENRFNPADTRLIHSGGECRSEDNNPTSPCS